MEDLLARSQVPQTPLLSHVTAGMGAAGGRAVRDEAQGSQEPMNGIVIRNGLASDAVAIARLLGDLGYPSELASIPKRLESLAADGRTVVFVAEQSGDVVGLATGQAFSAIHVDGEGVWLTSVVADPRVRRRGVGRDLVAAVEGWALARGCSRISVVTGLHRADAHSFYERLGYALAGRHYKKSLAPEA